MIDESRTERINPRRLSVWDLCLIGLVLFNLTWHLSTIQSQSLFIDEALEITMAKNSLAEIIWAPDSMPPLYQVILHSILAIGVPVEATRWFSALCGMSSIIVLYQLGGLTVGRPASLVATLLYALSPLQLYYAQLDRSYAMVNLIAILTMRAFWKASNSQSRSSWMIFAMWMVLGNYSHYYFPSLCVALLVGGFVSGLTISFRRLAEALAVIAIFSLPVLCLLPGDFGYQHDIRDPRPVSIMTLGYSYYACFVGFSLGPSPKELQQLGALAAFREALGWIVLLGAALAPLAVSTIHAIHSQRTLGWLACLAFLPVVLVGVVCHWLGLNYNVRHLLWILGPFLLLVTAGISSRHSMTATLATCVLVAVMVIANGQRIANDRYRNEDFRSVARYLDQRHSSDEPVFVVSDYMADLLDFYRPDAPRSISLPDPKNHSVEIESDQDAQNAVKTLRSLIRGRAWLVYSREFHGDPNSKLIPAIEKSLGLTLESSFAGVRLYRIVDDHRADE